jgi:hypothetical protein
MRKLKLDVGTLRVESFETRPADQGPGTVHGRVINPDYKDVDSTGCDGAGWGSLFGTCDGCPTVGTCIGPTYCCPETWRPTCNPSCNICTDPGCPP